MSAAHDWTRGSLAGLARVPALTPPTAPAPHPDAELLALSARYDAFETAWCAIVEADENGTPSDELTDPILEQQSPILDRLCELRATTMDGAVARFRTMVLEDWQLNPKPLLADSCVNLRLMGAFLRDFGRLAGVTWVEAGRMPVITPARAHLPLPSITAAAPPDDTQLLAVHAAFQSQQRHLLAIEKTANDDEFEAANQRWHELMDEAAALPACTAAGVLVKQALFVALLETRHRIDRGDYGEGVVLAMLGSQPVPG